MTEVVVSRLDDLTAGSAKRVEVDGQPVALVRCGDDVYAIGDTCSHANVSLSEGELDGCTLECWLHGSRFDIRTGEPSGPPAIVPINVYAVKIDGDDVYVATTPQNMER